MFEFFTAWGFLRDYWPWLLGGSVVIALTLAYADVTGSILLAVEALAGLGGGLEAVMNWLRVERPF
jgi:Sec-independent protein secretion pathway component TatC